jgi:hypothetical protein
MLHITTDKVIEQKVAEAWEVVGSPDSRVHVAGMKQLGDMIDNALADIGGILQCLALKAQ